MSVLPSPGMGSCLRLYQVAHDLVEGPGKVVASLPPAAYLPQPKRLPGQGRAESLVRDGVAPQVEGFEVILPGLVAGVLPVDRLPERQAEATEVRANIPWVRVAGVQFAVE